MCGVVGIVKRGRAEPVERERLERMRDLLRHRGPDGSGLWLSGVAGLGHRRLAIVDLESGQQPMLSADGAACIVFNGEIYNHLELRRDLEAQGARYRTRSDTETILQLYLRQGERCVEALQGMFAFAIWDLRDGTLLLARDRLGIKPLYYALDERELLFASEIKSLLAARASRPAFNRAVLADYLANRFVAGGETFFRGVRQLEPGRTLRFSRDRGLEERRYWSLGELDHGVEGARSGRRGVGLREGAARVRDGLSAAVASHLMSDVPLGVFLSGGLDSSGIAALMARLGVAPVRTFSVGFAEREADELAYARIAARAIGAEHREVVVSAEEFFDELPKLIWYEDEPIAFPSSVPLYFVSRLAARHVKVVLTGEGADELFLGYNRYRFTAWNERLARAMGALWPGDPRAAMQRLARRLPVRVGRYLERTFLTLSPGPRSLYFENFAVFRDDLREELLAAALGPARDPHALALALYEAGDGGSLERMSRADLQTYLVELLMKQDRMSMAASLESRVPFLDHRFVEQVAALPSRLKLRGWRTKAVLREALGSLVPAPILKRRKMGFPVPLSRWLRGPFRAWADELLLSPRALERGLFNRAALERLFAEHRDGVRDHADRLWLLVNLELWQRIFIDGEAAEAVARVA